MTDEPAADEPAEDVAPGNGKLEGVAEARKFYGAYVLNEDGTLTEAAIAAGWTIERDRVDGEPGPWDLVPPAPPALAKRHDVPFDPRSLQMDGETIVVEGKCPACSQGTLRLGVRAAPVSREQQGGQSNSVMCVNTSCPAPGTANKLLTSSWGDSTSTRLKRVQNVDLPDSPIEAGQQELVARYNDGATGRPAKYVDGKCTECGAAENVSHESWCSWAPVRKYDDDYTVYEDEGDLYYGGEFVGDDVAQSIQSQRTYTPVRKDQRPVGPDPAEGLYTCTPERCGHTPEDPCRAAVESADAQHWTAPTFEVPDTP